MKGKKNKTNNKKKTQHRTLIFNRSPGVDMFIIFHTRRSLT